MKFFDAAETFGHLGDRFVACFAVAMDDAPSASLYAEALVGWARFTFFTGRPAGDAYALALPAYVGTEVISRGLIALRDTQTPLITNLLQLAGRAAIMTLFVSRVGVIAIPVALAITAMVETVALGSVLFVKLQRYNA